MDEKGDKIACIIVEPVAGNMGVVPPQEGFLEALRETTKKSSAILIFDEVMTGFRVAYGGAQARYGVTPDLTTFGKIIGGGLPVGAYGGRRDIMSQIAPEGPVYQAGTLSGNPIAMAAGIATLEQLNQKDFYPDLEEKAAYLAAGFSNASEKAGIATQVGHVGSMLGIFFSHSEVKNFDDAKNCDLEMFAKFYKGVRQQGIYIAPSQFEALFISSAHKYEDLEKTIQVVAKTLTDLKR